MQSRSVRRMTGFIMLATLLIQSLAQAEEDWLARSQHILDRLEGQPRADWLDSNPHQAEANGQALELVNASKSKTLAAMPDGLATQPQGKPVRVMFVSFSLGDPVLKGIFQEASGQDDVLLVFRGPKPGQKLPGFFAELKALLKDIGPVPNIVIDPTRFQKWKVTTVPEVVVEAQGRALLRVKGVTSLDWVKARQNAGRQGDLGRFGEVYDIAEIDLLEAIKSRLATLDGPRLKQQAIARFWQKRPFEVLPASREDRDRTIDLTVTAPRDLMAPNGNLIIRAGHTVNPLDQMAFGLCLIVFDATQPAQLDTVKQLACRNKNARVLYLATQLSRQDGWEGLKNLETTLDAPVYLLTPDVRQRFQLQQVPAVVEQSGNRIVVRERKVLRSGAGARS
ncbi:TrbC family F-type conjugative pilus assembly protein [Methylomicrobium sp. RS1]|uniref:TrbC family F-type conjugative pilus assembly protein n=1 Tax=Candidatus Methylomicrobium oryzae TaxID=2802053 RepID=UPI001F43B133|nr:TrbC family F-type conjugative pilus assembly protein [Methylomicrobium sp. RS1]